jgi:hypothetical protein
VPQHRGIAQIRRDSGLLGVPQDLRSSPASVIACLAGFGGPSTTYRDASAGSSRPLLMCC